MNGNQPATILVVDDNGISRFMLQQHVKQLGYTVLAAENGREALAKLRVKPCDLVLLDIEMPELDGYAVLEQLKQDPQLRELPVIMVSGQDEMQSVVRCIEQGAEDFLPKPFDPVLLRARIGACLEKKRLRDIQLQKTTELEQALSQLRATQDQLIVQEKLASLGAITAGIAHEIKNPLNFICNFAKLSNELLGELVEEMQKPESDTEEVNEIVRTLQENMTKIRDHGQRADGIVRGMLMHSRGGKAEKQLTDVNALVIQSTDLAYHGLRATDSVMTFRLERELDPEVGSLEIVTEDMSRVFLNLANNACHATTSKRAKLGHGFVPELRVSTKNLGDSIEIRFRDNGTGIPPEIHDRLFQPFFTTKPSGSGTGLGLSISYDIVVKGHQGTLRAQSVENEYAEFIIALPRKKLK